MRLHGDYWVDLIFCHCLLYVLESLINRTCVAVVEIGINAIFIKYSNDKCTIVISMIIIVTIPKFKEKSSF